MISNIPPADWKAHGLFSRPAHVAGVLPHNGRHIMVTSASSATLAAVVADLACAIASNVIDSPLASKPGQNRRSRAGFAGGKASVATESVLILSTRPLDLTDAVTAAALARGISRPLDIAHARIPAPLSEASGAVRRIRDMGEGYFESEIGLIVVVADYAGTREGDADMARAILAISGAFPAPVLVVSACEPAEIPPEAVIMRLDDKSFSIENPVAGVPFTASVEREEVSFDGTDTTIVVKIGPRRAFEGVRRHEPPTIVEKHTVGRPKASERAEKIYLVQTGRQLSSDEAAAFGDHRWTDDYLNAVKLGGQSVEKRAEIIIVPSNRDPRREAAGSVVQRVKSQILNAGLDHKVSVSISPDIEIAA